MAIGDITTYTGQANTTHTVTGNTGTYHEVVVASDDARIYRQYNAGGGFTVTTRMKINTDARTYILKPGMQIQGSLIRTVELEGGNERYFVGLYLGRSGDGSYFLNNPGALWLVRCLVLHSFPASAGPVGNSRPTSVSLDIGNISDSMTPRFRLNLIPGNSDDPVDIWPDLLIAGPEKGAHLLGTGGRVQVYHAIEMV